MFKNMLQKRKLERLLVPPRKGGIIELDGLSIEYGDGLSLYFEYLDIFQKRIYHFNACGPAPVIIDAGGCIGMSTLYFKRAYPEAHVTVFEPDPGVFALLERNMKRNGIKGVTLVNSGLGKAEGTIDFYADGSDGGSALLASETSKAMPVRVERLSSYLAGPVDLVKMNIEGMECEVFEEIEGKLHLVREVVFEYHAFDDLPQTLHRILEILDRNGFRYVVADACASRVPVPFELPAGYRNFALVYAVNRRFEGR